MKMLVVHAHSAAVCSMMGGICYLIRTNPLPDVTSLAVSMRLRLDSRAGVAWNSDNPLPPGRLISVAGDASIGRSYSKNAVGKYVQAMSYAGRLNDHVQQSVRQVS